MAHPEFTLVPHDGMDAEAGSADCTSGSAFVLFHSSEGIAIGIGILEPTPSGGAALAADDHLPSVKLPEGSAFWVVRRHSWTKADTVDTEQLREEFPEQLGIGIVRNREPLAAFQIGEHATDEEHTLARLVAAFALSTFVVVNDTELHEVSWLSSYPGIFGQPRRLTDQQGARRRLEIDLLDQFPVLKRGRVSPEALSLIMRTLANTTLTGGIEGLLR